MKADGSRFLEQKKKNYAKAATTSSRCISVPMQLKQTVAQSF